MHQAIDFLNEHHIAIPDYGRGPLACTGRRSLTGDLHGSSDETHEPLVLASELGNWPIQLQLLNSDAPYLKNADLLVAADCTPFAYVRFHQRFSKGKVLIILCPKLDRTSAEYADKLSEIFQKQDIKSISIVHMEIPCCSGIETIVGRGSKKREKT